MILLLHRAKKNFGDYLIFNRGLCLIKHIKNPKIVIGDASIPLENQFSVSEINNFDSIVIPGGPGLRPNAYPVVYPLSKLIFKMNIPLYFLGIGSKIYPYNKKKENINFDNDTIRFFKYLNHYAKIGVRDHLSKRVLDNTKIQSVVNGCTAWYSLPEMEHEFYKPKDIKTIVFSVPAGSQFQLPFYNLIKHFRKNNPEIRYIISYNHGYPSRDEGTTVHSCIFEKIKELKCEFIDMSGSSNDTSAYDDCDIHIGYRVHSHIYFLSKGKPSFLIAEDSRAVGVIETLMTPGYLHQLTNPDKGSKLILKVYKNVLPSKYWINLQKYSYRLPDITEHVYYDVFKEFNNGFKSFDKVKDTIKIYYKNYMKPYVENI